MKKLLTAVSAAVLFLFSLSALSGCDKDDQDPRSSIIEGLTLDNYPSVDGSTSTAPLNTIIACKLLGVQYRWTQGYGNIQGVEPRLNKRYSAKFQQQIRSSQTHGAFVSLIEGGADLILSARTMSPDEKSMADAADVSLIETPIALDAFIFIINPNNSVHSLTIPQVQGIYTGEITNWKDVGGNDAQINPYVRNANSGSQELMESLVMKDLDMSQFPESPNELITIHGMVPTVERIESDRDGICYTVYYYKENIITRTSVKTIGINGVYPDKNTIADKSYPYFAEVYAVIRDDLDKSSMAYKIYEWLQTPQGRETIAESGYVPY